MPRATEGRYSGTVERSWKVFLCIWMGKWVRWRETSESRTYLGDSAKNLLNPRTPILPCAPSTTPELFRVSLAGHHRTNGVLLVKLREKVLGV